MHVIIRVTGWKIAFSIVGIPVGRRFFLSTFIIELLCIPVCCCLVNRAAGTSFTCAKNMWVLMLFSSHKREMKGFFCPPSRGND